MLDIAEELNRWVGQGRRFAVATVVAVGGSAPRQAGAALAVDGDGTAIGSVSGGCVEGAVYELCRQALEDGRTVLESFGYSDEDAFAVGLTCGGVIDVLVTPLPARAAAAPGVDTPDPVVPGADVPDVGMPGVDVPGVGMPGVDVPGVGVPDEGVPGAGAPDPPAPTGGVEALGRGPGAVPDRAPGPAPAATVPRTAAESPPVAAPAGHREVLAAALAAAARGEAAALARIVAGPDRLLGRALLVRPDGSYDGTLGGRPALDRTAAAEAGALLHTGRTGTVVLGEDGGRCGSPLTLLVESSVPPPRMIVFGAVDFASALVKAGRFLGHHVTVCDARPVFATRARFPEADEIVVDWPHRYLQGTRVDSRTALCVLTHDPKFDVPLLELALRLPVAYVGAMGSRRTHEDRERRLREAGVGERELARLHSPIGLDLGARTPEETALSIAAEIVADRRGGSGVPLSGARIPIHHDVPAGHDTPDHHHTPAGHDTPDHHHTPAGHDTPDHHHTPVGHDTAIQHDTPAGHDGGGRPTGRIGSGV